MEREDIKNDAERSEGEGRINVYSILFNQVLRKNLPLNVVR